MAYYGWDEVAYVLIGGYDLKTTVTGLALEDEAVMVEKHFASNVYPTNIVLGTGRGAVEIESVLNSPTTDQINSTSGTGRVLSVLYAGNTVSELAALYRSVKVGGISLVLTPDDIHGLKPTVTNSGKVYLTARVVAPVADRSTAGNTDTTYCDLGAAAATGTVALHVTSLTLGGYTNVVVALRDSADHVTFADHTTMTAVTAIGAEAKDLAAACNRYVSISWAWTGAGSGQSWTGGVLVGAD